MTSLRIATVAVCALASAPLAAQDPPAIPIRVVGHPLDSGFLHNPGAADRVVFRATLRAELAQSLRVRFGAVSLPAGSTLRLTGALDGAVQVFDARSLAAWSAASAVFNGGEVAVELRAAGGSRGNRVVVAALEVGEPVGTFDPLDSLSGADDRAPSSDPRQGRQYPTGCTAWLVNEFTVLTAGHCVTNPAQLIHFNVPPSSLGGALRYPPPSDQYPYEAGTLQSMNGGVGADWAVVRAQRNSNTGLYPGQAQRAWYELGSVPASTAGQTIRITGYGTTSSPVDPTWNQLQKTHADALTRIESTYLRYVPDTTGGNSGSPIVHENTGLAVGIHTHGGCTSGGNLGTRIDRADLRTALQAVMGSRILGRVATLGQGCAGGAGVLDLAVPPADGPVIGRTTTAVLGGVVPGAATTFAYGFTDARWNGQPLPWPIPFAPGCTVWSSVDATVAAVAGPAGTAALGIALPADGALVGFTFFVQGYAVEAGGAGGQPALRASNALRLTVGRDR